MKLAHVPMSRLAAGAGLAAALALAACHPPHVRRHDWGDRRPMSVANPLVCPQAVGGLKRTAQASDGQSCAYVGGHDLQVTLQRLAVADHDPIATLAPIEATLRPLIPPRDGPAPVSVDAGDGSSDHAQVDLPGVRVKAEDDRAEVQAFGVTVRADGKNAAVNLGQGSSRTVVLAGPNGAEVRVADVGPTNADLVLVLTADRPGPSGLHAVGYLARGPLAGPLAVVTFRSAAGRHEWRRDRDLNSLLALNVKQ
jgi:hypothetical protein